MPSGVPFFTKSISRFVLEILPAAAVLVIGGILFAQFEGWSFSRSGSAPAAMSGAASEAAMKLVRDEHNLLDEMLKADLEQQRAENAALTTPPKVAEAEPRRPQQPAATAKLSTPKAPGPVASKPQATPSRPAQQAAQPAEPLPVVTIASGGLVAPEGASEPEETAPKRDPLFTFMSPVTAFADKVVEVTKLREASAAVGAIPTWIANTRAKVFGGSQPEERDLNSTM